MNRRRVVLISILIILIGIIWWGYSKLEWVEKSVDLGFKAKALKNPYLAAMKYLTQQRINVSDASHWKIPEKNNEMENTGTLIDSSSRLYQGKRQQDEIWNWVKSGGYLITNAQSFTNSKTGLSKDYLLNKLNLQLYPVIKKGARNRIRGRKPIRPWLNHAITYDKKSCSRSKGQIKLQYAGEPKSLNIDITPGLFLKDKSKSAKNWLNNDDGIQMIQYQVGNGQITVLTDMSLWTNGRIACNDNAYLLWLMVSGKGNVGFTYNIKSATLAQLLWKNAPMVIAISVILLLFWIWNRSNRFGPLLIIRNQNRRNLKEHLSASATFLWAHKKYEKLYKPLQQSIFQKLRLKHQNSIDLNSNERSQFVSQLTGIDIKKIDWALNYGKYDNKTSFIKLIQTLQLIRNRI